LIAAKINFPVKAADVEVPPVAPTDGFAAAEEFNS